MTLSRKQRKPERKPEQEIKYFFYGIHPSPPLSPPYIYKGVGVNEGTKIILLGVKVLLCRRHYVKECYELGVDDVIPVAIPMLYNAIRSKKHGF